VLLTITTPTAISAKVVNRQYQHLSEGVVSQSNPFEFVSFHVFTNLRLHSILKMPNNKTPADR